MYFPIGIITFWFFTKNGNIYLEYLHNKYIETELIKVDFHAENEQMSVRLSDEEIPIFDRSERVLSNTHTLLTPHTSHAFGEITKR